MIHIKKKKNLKKKKNNLLLQAQTLIMIMELITYT